MRLELSVKVEVTPLIGLLDTIVKNHSQQRTSGRVTGDDGVNLTLFPMVVGGDEKDIKYIVVVYDTTNLRDPLHGQGSRFEIFADGIDQEDIERIRSLYPNSGAKRTEG